MTKDEIVEACAKILLGYKKPVIIDLFEDPEIITWEKLTETEKQEYKAQVHEIFKYLKYLGYSSL